jgi:hypothetical protein
MKNINRLAVDDILHDFQQIASCIKANDCILVYEVFQLSFIYLNFNNFAYIGFSKTVLEGLNCMLSSMLYHTI